GAGGPIFDWIRWLYANMEYEVSYNGETSLPFQSSLGLLTGDSASPGFWNLFFGDFWLPPLHGDILIDGVYIAHVGQADGLLIFSRSLASLQSHLCSFCLYASLKGLNPSAPKTLCLAFGPLPHTLPPIFMNGAVVRWAHDGIYLGITLSPTQRFIFHAYYLSKARTAEGVAYCVFGAEKIAGRFDVDVGLALFTTLIRPHLLGAADVILDVNPASVKLLEEVQTSYLRRLLGMQTSAALHLFPSETGILPVACERLLLAVGYLKYLLRLDPSHYAARAFQEQVRLAKRGHACFAHDLIILLEQRGISISPDELTDEETVSSLTDRIRTAEQTAISKAFCNGTDRCILPNYTNRGKSAGLRAYLRIATGATRNAYIRLVFGTHSLRIVRGAWEGIPREERLCRICNSFVESESHA
ncbi:hypothetical protein DL93DRAFT_2038531, partial [Clavulina sp. PMI_390]